MQTVITNNAENAPDTLRDQDLSGGTEPMHPMHTIPSEPPIFSTKPLKPIKAGMKTKPLTPPIQQPEKSQRDRAIAPPPPPMGRPSFEVYGADDTYAGNHPAVELPFDTDTERQYKIGLGVFGALVILVVSLAAIGSCDDKPTPGSAETTAATVSATPTTAPAQPSASVLAPTAAPQPAEAPSAPPLPSPKKKKRH